MANLAWPSCHQKLREERVDYFFADRHNPNIALPWGMTKINGQGFLLADNEELRNYNSLGENSYGIGDSVCLVCHVVKARRKFCVWPGRSFSKSN